MGLTKVRYEAVDLGIEERTVLKRVIIKREAIELGVDGG
jgi:hypothetical protein